MFQHVERRPRQMRRGVRVIDWREYPEEIPNGVVNVMNVM